MIFCADIHARQTKPRARTDDFLLSQDKKLNFICQEAVKSPPLCISGDILDIPRSGPWLEQYLIRLFRHYDLVPIITLGQHDLVNHSIEQFDQSSIGVLEAAGVVRVLTKQSGPLILTDRLAIWGCAYGEVPDESMVDYQRDNLLLWHKMVINDPLWPGQEADKAAAILRKYPQFDLIVTGDNHQSFAIADSKGHWLVNPGSMMRNTTAQIDHRPCIFKWENDKLEQIFLPIDTNVLDLSVTDIPKEKAGRFGAFVDQLQGGGEIGISFDDNLTKYFHDHPEEPQVQELVWEARGD